MVEFPAEKPSYYPMQTAIIFIAPANGRRLLCFIEIATLTRHDACCREGTGMEAFSDGDLFIRAREFALFTHNVARPGGSNRPIDIITTPPLTQTRI